MFLHSSVIIYILHNCFGETISISMPQGFEGILIIMQKNPSWQSLKYIEFPIPK